MPAPLHYPQCIALQACPSMSVMHKVKVMAQHKHCLMMSARDKHAPQRRFTGKNSLPAKECSASGSMLRRNGKSVSCFLSYKLTVFVPAGCLMQQIPATQLSCHNTSRQHQQLLTLHCSWLHSRPKLFLIPQSRSAIMSVLRAVRCCLNKVSKTP